MYTLRGPVPSTLSSKVAPEVDAASPTFLAHETGCLCLRLAVNKNGTSLPDAAGRFERWRTA